LLASPGRAAASDIVTPAGPHEAFAWLSAGQPFYLIAMQPNQKVRWSGALSAGFAMHLPESHKAAYEPEVYDFPGWNTAKSTWRWSSVRLCVKVLSGDVSGTVKLGAVDVAGMTETEAVSHWQDYENNDYVHYWRMNFKNAPSPRQFFNGAFSVSSPASINLGRCLPEYLDIKFTNGSAAGDKVVACYLVFTFPDGRTLEQAEILDEGNWQGGAHYGYLNKSEFFDLVSTVIQCSAGDAIASDEATARTRIGTTALGGKFGQMKDKFNTYFLTDGLSGNVEPLFDVTVLEVGNVTMKTTGGLDAFTIRPGQIVDEWKWDQAYLTSLNLWPMLRVFRLVMLFVFLYYTWLHIWKDFNR